jgi:hypothetical protein
MRPGNSDRPAGLIERQLQLLPTLAYCSSSIDCQPPICGPIGLRNICCGLDNIWLHRSHRSCRRGEPTMIVTASEVSQLPALIGVQQACDLLGISRSTGYRAAAAGDLPTIRQGVPAGPQRCDRGGVGRDVRRARQAHSGELPGGGVAAGGEAAARPGIDVVELPAQPPEPHRAGARPHEPPGTPRASGGWPWTRRRRRHSASTAPAQAEERLMVGPGWVDSGLVFTWPEGRALHPERFTRWFQQHAHDAGLPKIRLHAGGRSGPGRGCREQSVSNRPNGLPDLRGGNRKTAGEAGRNLGVTEGTRTPDLRDHNSTRPLPADSSRSL